MTIVTAAELAEDAGIGYERFREVLAKCGFDWHEPNDLWQAEEGSMAHRDMHRVLERLLDQDGRLEASGTSAAYEEREAWDGYVCAAISGLMQRNGPDPVHTARMAARHADALMGERRSRTGG